jgi:hypothetical protein
MFLDRGGHALSTFAAAEREQLERAMTELAKMIATKSKKTVRIEDIDGEPALRSKHAPLFKETGLTFDHRGLIIERVV